MDYEELETRLSLIEARIASLESRQSIIERFVGKVVKRKPRRELTPEDRKAIRERLVKGQEAARARRETEEEAS